MKNRLYLFFLIALAPFATMMTGCGEDDTVNPQDEQAQLQVLFAADDIAAADLLIDDEVFASAKIFGDVVGYDSVRASNVDVTLESAGTGTILFDERLNFVPDQNYTMFVVNDSSGTVDIIRFRDDLTAPPTGKALVRFAHLVYNGPTVRVGLEGTGVKLTEAVSYGEITESFNAYDPGTYNVRVIDTAESGAGGGQGGAPAIVEKELTLEAGGIYTVAAGGGLLQAELFLLRHN